ncbi:LOW QUALITY PROTEIN: probable E3 ubiquitin-protein ligase HIP1 [Salvia miltiorrhiza]|uniref:LOW QUALITY PROTEIN: probable E3 ubiquitin-protein ligase HIP1 n=1 Tax=Salvia miltiorrhiza TaxID=226208 RepID=UPI0025AB61CD|nr:LOW QUALITY PROTEIN: probable E3 ubiquitin-protein ligase HIP1 [Salvia miltiorrhiza]
MKKRSLEGDSSESSRGRQTSAAAHVSSSSSSTSVSDSRHSSCPSGSDSSTSASVRTGGSANVNKSRTRLSYRQNGRNTSSFRESSIRVSRFPDSEPPRNVGRPRLSQQYSPNASSSGLSSYSLSHSSSNDDSRSTLMPYTSAEPGYSHFVNRDMLQRYNMDGIAEVLLALERIGQDEEMTHEQILALETSLFLNGLNLYDQHRDMRLDIDDMSYEELLALGDRMGTVSTALSEKELSKCIKRSIYQFTPTEAGFTESGEDGDDVKCSICQEEVLEGRCYRGVSRV